MLILDQQTHATAVRSGTFHSPFAQPFQPESRRRIRPLSHPFVPPTHLYPAPYAAGSSTALHMHTPTLQHLATAAARVTPSTATTVSFLRLAIVFVAGGLFFSSAMATMTACYAIGKDNVHRFREMARIAWQGVWLTFTMGLGATRAALFGRYDDEPSFWRRYVEAWRVLRCKMAETRQKAVEGVQALQREVKLTAAAVGPPGLIPLQYMLDRQLDFLISGGIEGALQGAVDSVDMSNMNLKLSHFDPGKVAPKLESARVYDLGNDAMAFDYDVTWESELEATIQVHTNYLPSKLPVTLHNVQFRGPVRVVMTPLTKEYPGFGATLVSFPSMPEIGMDIRVAGGEVTKVVPMVRAELLAAIERSIAESMIWPKRAVVPSYPMDDPTTPILSEEELKKLETTDPLLEAEEAMGTRPVLRRKLNQMSDLLYCDHCSDADLVDSIVDLPMPTFKTKEKTSHHQTTGKPNKPSIASIMEHGGVLEQLQKATQMVVDRSQADVAKTQQLLQTSGIWKNLQKAQLESKKKLEQLYFTTLP